MSLSRPGAAQGSGCEGGERGQIGPTPHRRPVEGRVTEGREPLFELAQRRLGRAGVQVRLGAVPVQLGPIGRVEIVAAHRVADRGQARLDPSP